MLNEHDLEALKPDFASFGAVEDFDAIKRKLSEAAGKPNEDEVRARTADVIEAIGRMLGGDHVEKSKAAADKIRHGNPKTDEQKARNCIAELRDMARSYRTTASEIAGRYLGGTMVRRVSNKVDPTAFMTEVEVYFVPTTHAPDETLAIGKSNTPRFKDFLLASALSTANAFAQVYLDKADEAEALANTWEAELDAASADKVVRLGA